jgi:hypothetical protein
MQLVDDIGFDPVDAGTMDESWRQQPGTPGYLKDDIAACAVRWRKRRRNANLNGALRRTAQAHSSLQPEHIVDLRFVHAAIKNGYSCARTILAYAKNGMRTKAATRPVLQLGQIRLRSTGAADCGSGQ